MASALELEPGRGQLLNAGCTLGGPTQPVFSSAERGAAEEEEEEEEEDDEDEEEQEDEGEEEEEEEEGTDGGVWNGLGGSQLPASVDVGAAGVAAASAEELALHESKFPR